MMKKFLHDKKGETLVETLAAILIFTMASIALYTMVTTASSMNIQVRHKSEEVQEQVLIAEQASGDENRTENNIVFKIPDPKSTGTISVSETVDVYRKNADSVYTYFLKTNGGH